MLKKLFLFLSLLVCAGGEVIAQGDNSTPTKLVFNNDIKPDWFDDYCDGVTIERPAFDKCVHRLTGVYKIKTWIDDNFPIYGETTATIFSYESADTGHAWKQKSIISSLVVGRIAQYNSLLDSHTFDYSTLAPGTIITRASPTDFEDENGDVYNLREGKTVFVTSTGNENITNKRIRHRGFNDDIAQLPFPILAGGFNMAGWIRNCGKFFGTDIFRPGLCGIYRADSLVQGGSNYCGEKAEKHCVLGSYLFGPGSSGTSNAAAHIGSVIWAVAYFLKNKYKWKEPMTQLQAAVTAVAVVKSCAIDIGPPGPDPENGLGILSVECLNDDSDDGFIDNPLSVIKDDLYLVPDDSYVKPQLAETISPCTRDPEACKIRIRAKVFLEGVLY